MITDFQREKRKNHVGSSDVAAILDLWRDPATPSFDPFTNAYNVWLEKTGKLKDKEKTGSAISLGKLLENAILEMAEQSLGKIRRNQYRVVKDLPILAASTDGIVMSTGEPVEAKTTNLTWRGGPDTDHWGDEGTDDVPPRVIIQCTVQMMAAKAQVCHNPVIIGGRGFVMFRISLDNDFAQMILERVGEFWDKYIKTDTPPANCTPSMELLKRVRRIPKTIAPVSDSLVEKWENLRQASLQIEKDEKQAEAEMLAPLGTAEAGQLSDGRLLTYYEQSREIIDGKRLKEELPDVAAKYIKQTTYRVPRLQKRKLLKG